MLADRTRKKLVVCNADGIIVTELNLDIKPIGLAIMNTKEMAISYNESKPGHKWHACIEIIDLSSLKHLRQFKVKGHCKGIIYRNLRFIVACENYIQILDHDGKQNHCINRPRACIRYVCTDDLDRVYFTDWNSNCLCCVIDDKTEVYNYQHPDLLGPTSVDVDAMGHCYVVGFISNNIHLLNSDGALLQILLSANDGLHEPRIIKFRPFSREFVVIDNECDFKLFELTGSQ